MSLEPLIAPEIKTCSDNDGDRVHLAGAPTGKIWNNLSIGVNNDSNSCNALNKIEHHDLIQI